MAASACGGGGRLTTPSDPQPPLRSVTCFQVCRWMALPGVLCREAHLRGDGYARVANQRGQEQGRTRAAMTGFILLDAFSLKRGGPRVTDSSWFAQIFLASAWNSHIPGNSSVPSKQMFGHPARPSKQASNVLYQLHPKLRLHENLFIPNSSLKNHVSFLFIARPTFPNTQI